MRPGVYGSPAFIWISALLRGSFSMPVLIAYHSVSVPAKYTSLRLLQFLN